MTYRIRVTGPATRDIEKQARHIAVFRKEPTSADRWRAGVFALLRSLSAFPRSHPKSSLNTGFEDELRYAVYFSHIVIFGIDDEKQVVTVYRVAHGASAEIEIEIDFSAE